MTGWWILLSQQEFDISPEAVFLAVFWLVVVFSVILMANDKRADRMRKDQK